MSKLGKVDLILDRQIEVDSHLGSFKSRGNISSVKMSFKI